MFRPAGQRHREGQGGGAHRPAADLPVQRPVRHLQLPQQADQQMASEVSRLNFCLTAFALIFKSYITSYISSDDFNLEKYLKVSRLFFRLHGILAGYGDVKLRQSTGGMANEEAPVHLVSNETLS